jgi:hypothetical protein
VHLYKHCLRIVITNFQHDIYVRLILCVQDLYVVDYAKLYVDTVLAALQSVVSGRMKPKSDYVNKATMCRKEKISSAHL